MAAGRRGGATRPHLPSKPAQSHARRGCRRSRHKIAAGWGSPRSNALTGIWDDSGVSVERRGVVYAQQVLSAFVIQLNPMVMFSEHRLMRQNSLSEHHPDQAN